MVKRKSAGRAASGLAALLFVAFAAGGAIAEVNVNINVGPPAVVVAGPPEVVAIPRTLVYFAPGADADLFFYAGYWWTPERGRWFRSRTYDGHWIMVPARAVPAPILRVPGNYRQSFRHGHRIPYGQLKKHYARREREKRERRGEWRNRKNGRAGHGGEDRREPRGDGRSGKRR